MDDFGDSVKKKVLRERKARKRSKERLLDGYKLPYTLMVAKYHESIVEEFAGYGEARH